MDQWQKSADHGAGVVLRRSSKNKRFNHRDCDFLTPTQLVALIMAVFHLGVAMECPTGTFESTKSIFSVILLDRCISCYDKIPDRPVATFTLYHLNHN